MPEFDTYVDVDVNEFVSACSKREIKELIECLVEDGHVSPTALGPVSLKLGVLETPFIEKMDELKQLYYRLSKEDEEILEKLFEKYL
jgi:hypothetical protein